MKKFVFMLAAALILAAGCEKAEQPAPAKTTYTLTDDSRAYEGAVEYLQNLGYTLGGDMTDDGFTVKNEYTIIEYIGSQRVGQNVATNLKKGESRTFTATKGAEYVTVMWELEVKTAKQKSGATKYVANAFYLTEGQDTHITITSATKFSTAEPKK